MEAEIYMKLRLRRTGGDENSFSCLSISFSIVEVFVLFVLFWETGTMQGYTCRTQKIRRSIQDHYVVILLYAFF